MCPHVCLEITDLGARVVALLTVEQLFSGMGEHVSLKDTRLCKGELTMCASEWFLLCMCSLVSSECWNRRKSSCSVCNWEAFPLLSESACVSFEYQRVCKSICIVCNGKVFLLNGSACVS